MMFRSLLFVVVLSVLCGSGSAQDSATVQEPERTTDWDRFEVRSWTRLGPAVFGAGIPEKIEFENSRFSEGFRFGRNNSFLGVDYDAPGSRFRETSPGIARRSSEILSEKATKLQNADSASVNTPAPADVGAPQHVPIRRPVGFFQRPEIMESPTAADEAFLRTPREQRWFRESGGRQQGPRSEEPSSGGDAVGMGALGVGGETVLRRSGPNAATSPLRTPVQDLPLNPEQTRRKFEEKLEGMLLSDPSVHLLSPVQISFSGGTVTVRGVVPNQVHKVAVGKILLTDPAVKQVNNMISVAPLDPNQNPPPIDNNPIR